VAVNEVALLLMAEWERVEGKPVNVSYVATFTDMARALRTQMDARDAAWAEKVAAIAQEKTKAVNETLRIARVVRRITGASPLQHIDVALNRLGAIHGAAEADKARAVAEAAEKALSDAADELGRTRFYSLQDAAIAERVVRDMVRRIREEVGGR
jgi:hypothetical protein